MRTPRTPREPGISRLCRVPALGCGEPLVDPANACDPRIEIKACPSVARVRVAWMLDDARRRLPVGRRLRGRKLSGACFV